MPQVHTLSQPERPTPIMAERIPLALPNLPEAMIGRTILHLTDLHVRRYRPWFRRMIRMAGHERPDFVCLTGDYMTVMGDEGAALRVLGDLIDVLQPRVGTWACFGNHDSEAFKRLASDLPGAVWLEHEAQALPEFGITFLGSSTPCDMMRTMHAARNAERAAGVEPGSLYRIMLAHEPSALIPAAELGVEWTLAGHTHGGQWRFGLPMALKNSADLPLTHSSGILRCRDSVCTISRGLGETYFDFRLLCPPQMPLYVLDRGPAPGHFTRRMECVRWW